MRSETPGKVYIRVGHTEWEAHGVETTSGVTRTELDTHRVGHWTWIHAEWDIYRVGYIKCGTYKKWKSPGMGHIQRGI